MMVRLLLRRWTHSVAARLAVRCGVAGAVDVSVATSAADAGVSCRRRWGRRGHVMNKGRDWGRCAVVHRSRVIGSDPGRASDRVQGRRRYSRRWWPGCMRVGVRATWHVSRDVGISRGHVDRVMQVVDVVQRRWVTVTGMVVV